METQGHERKNENSEARDIPRSGRPAALARNSSDSPSPSPSRWGGYLNPWNWSLPTSSPAASPKSTTQQQQEEELREEAKQLQEQVAAQQKQLAEIKQAEEERQRVQQQTQAALAESLAKLQAETAAKLEEIKQAEENRKREAEQRQIQKAAKKAAKEKEKLTAVLNTVVISPPPPDYSPLTPPLRPAIPPSDGPAEPHPAANLAEQTGASEALTVHTAVMESLSPQSSAMSEQGALQQEPTRATEQQADEKLEMEVATSKALEAATQWEPENTSDEPPSPVSKTSLSVPTPSPALEQAGTISPSNVLGETKESAEKSTTGATNDEETNEQSTTDDEATQPNTDPITTDTDEETATTDQPALSSTIASWMAEQKLVLELAGQAPKANLALQQQFENTKKRALEEEKERQEQAKAAELARQKQAAADLYQRHMIARDQIGF